MSAARDPTHPSQPASAEHPILIIGAPRSGTTLLATMMNTHPRLFVANEAKILLHVLGHVRDPHKPIRRSTAEALLARAARRELAGYAPLPSLEEALPSNVAPTYANVLRGLFAALARREGKARWGEKTAVAYRGLGSLARAFPGARFVALRRDPTEVVRSYLNVNPKWGGMGALVHLTDFQRAIASLRDDIALCMVDYHELVTHPETTLRALCAFLGEDYVPAMLTFHATDRARALATSPEFAGAARPVFVRPAAAGSLSPALTRAIGMYTAHAARITAGRTAVPVWERLVKALVYARAAAYQGTAIVANRWRRR